MGNVQSDKLRSAPVQALRAVFSGVGQLFLAADKVKTQAQERTADAGNAIAARQAATRKARPQPRRPDLSRASAGAAAGARSDSRWRSLDQTGNVRLLTAEDVAEAVPDGRPDREGSGGPSRRGSTAPREHPRPAFGTRPAGNGQPAARIAEAELPVANYDALSLPSLRARLRTLDETQLAQLLQYEQGHAARADVLSMFQNRMAKLRAGA